MIEILLAIITVILGIVCIGFSIYLVTQAIKSLSHDTGDVILYGVGVAIVWVCYCLCLIGIKGFWETL